jgi:hypothetical protein
MRGAVPPLPQYVFLALCLVKHRDNFTFSDHAKKNLKLNIVVLLPWKPAFSVFRQSW